MLTFEESTKELEDKYLQLVDRLIQDDDKDEKCIEIKRELTQVPELLTKAGLDNDGTLKASIMSLAMNAIADIVARQDEVATACLFYLVKALEKHEVKINDTIKTLTFLTSSQKQEIQDLKEELRFLKSKNDVVEEQDQHS